MKTKLIALTLVVVITVVFLSFAQFTYAHQENTPLMEHKMMQQKSGEFREMMGRRLEVSDVSPAAKMIEFIEYLNLSEEQMTEVKKISLDFQKDTLELRNRTQIKELEIKA